MAKDSIVEEVRKARHRYAARFGFDLDAIYRDLKQREKLGEFTTVCRKPRRRRTETSGRPRRRKLVASG
jgi:hypothetical protein